MTGIATIGRLVDRLGRHVRTATLVSPFDPRARPIYIILGCELLVGLALLGGLGFTIDWRLWPLFATWPLVALGGMMVRRLGHGAWGGALEATGLVISQGALSLTLLVPLAAASGPFADQLLAAADRAIGFDWPAFAHASIGWRQPLTFAYGSFLWQELIVIGVLFATGRSTRCWQFVAAATVALVFTMAIFPFAPAQGPFVYYGLSRAYFEPLIGVVPWEYLDDMNRLKDGYRVFDRTVTTGYVSFPSYHTAVALLFTWAIWPYRWLRAAFVILNLCLILGALLIGSHYFVDLIGGAVVAVAGLFVGRKLIPTSPLVGD